VPLHGRLGIYFVGEYHFVQEMKAKGACVVENLTAGSHLYFGIDDSSIDQDDSAQHDIESRLLEDIALPKV